jgi:uncharacterized protein YggU (UPF0235/DUF167 family)
MRQIKVKVFPDFKKQKIEEREPETFRVYIREKAQDNMANKGLIRALAEHFSLPEKNIRIVSGHHKSNKVIEIINMSEI